jgi:uncharacterized protein
MGEGAFYLWADSELRDVLGDGDGDGDGDSSGSDMYRAFARRYGVRPGGNIRHAESDPHGEMAGMNHLFVAERLENNEEDALCRQAIARLRAARSRTRARPGLDDKVLTAWNGLAITGLARCGAVLHRTAWVEAAETACDALRAHVFDEHTGRLCRVWRRGERGDPAAFADDYAFLVQGLLDVYGASLNSAYLLWADGLQRTMNRLFFSDAAGGWCSTEAGQEDVLIRTREVHDGAEPSASSVALRNCERLARLLGDSDGEGDGELAPVIASVRRWALADGTVFSRTHGAIAPSLFRALKATEAPHRSLVLVGRRSSPALRAMLACIHDHNDEFLPVLLLDPSDAGLPKVLRGREWLQAIASGSTGASPEAARAFFCVENTCRAPVSDADALRELLLSESH